jgi:Carboxypeptidase regulatory-like domain/TonB dependent receptor
MLSGIHNSTPCFRPIVSCFLLALLLAFSCRYAQAQLDRGTIQVIVSDQSGAVISKAVVTVTDTATAQKWQHHGSSNGQYNFPYLPAGQYQVDVNAPGYSEAQLTNVVLNANDTTSQHVSLSVGAATQSVTVSGSEVGMNLETPELGAVISGKQVKQLPLNGRDFTDLLALIPGSINSAGQQGTQNSMDGFSTATIGADVQVDGTDATRIDCNCVFTTFGNGDARITRSSIDDIQEVRVLSSDYSAESGRSIGDIINVISKSGTNSTHGEVYNYFRNNALDAKNYFATPGVGFAFRMNQFGGNLGGKIIKDKLFYFVNYEGIRQAVDNATFAYVLNQKMRASAAPAIQPLVALIPLGNAGPAPTVGNTNFGYWFDRYNGETTQNLQEDTGAIKLDYILDPRNSFSFRFNDNEADTAGAYGLATGEVADAPEHVQLGKFTWNYSTENFINAAGVAVNRVVSTQSRGESNPNLACNGCAVGLELVPNPQFAANVPDDSIQLIDTATKIIGGHTLSFGLNLQKNQVNRELDSESTITFAGGPPEAGAAVDPTLGIPSGGPEGFLADQGVGLSVTGYPMTGVWNSYYSFFVNDNWRASHRLSLNLGLRYDYNTVVHDPTHKVENFNLSTLSLESGNTPFYQRNWTDFAPRVGFNWDPTGKGETSVKGGYGLFFLPIAPGDVLNLAANTNQNISINIYQNLTCTPSLNISYPLPPVLPTCTPAAPSSVSFLQPRTPDSYSEHYSLSLQQQIAHNTVFTLAYVGNHGLHISTGLNLNPQSPVTNQRAISNAYGGLNLAGYLAGSKYNAMQFNLQRSSSHGLTVNASYTWAHERDDELGLFETYQNVQDLHQEWANGDTDVRNAFSLGLSYEIPTIPVVPKAVGKGWQVTSVTQVRSGLPFSVNLPGYLNANTYRPDCILSNPRATNYSAPNNQLNAAAFSVPAVGVYGNCQRNIARGPVFVQPDVGFVKLTQITERVGMEFRGEFFNIINHPNFANPGATLGGAGFGQSTSTIGSNLGNGTARQAQLSAKFIF